MRQFFGRIYRFLPIQLFLLHFRKYELMLLFWVVLFLTLSGNFATHFGASTLFLAPEYLGAINFLSMLLLGAATAVFIMSWNITTFIIHSHRFPFFGATRQAFLKYCINNALLPLIYFVFYTVICVHYQWLNEHTSIQKIIVLQTGFYLGVVLVLFLSFIYFFRVDRDLFKIVLSKITNPSLIREIVPYDTLDLEIDIVKADTYLSENLKIKHINDLTSYHPRLLNTVLRKHHRNAIAATFFSLVLLILLGIFMDDPRFRIPAGAGFLILFSVVMSLVGAVKYFLKTWELVGWVVIAVVFSFLVKTSVINLGSIAYGLNYEKNKQPVYGYEELRKKFTPQLYARDKYYEELRLNNWLKNNSDSINEKPTLVILAVSGGGSRSAYWSFRTLQYLDSVTNGKLFKRTVLLTGASGGMLGASYWHGIHTQVLDGKLKEPYSARYQDNIGKDLLNAVISSFAGVDFISPFNKISIAGRSYNRDRGYAMEQEIIRNTEGVMNKDIGEDREQIAQGKIPNLIINGTIVNDGRKLMMSSQPISYLTQPAYALTDSFARPIDAIDYGEFFSKQNPYKTRLTTALRMSATFPYVLPQVKLPTQPQTDVMDGGMRDNFGMEVATRYYAVHKEWIEKNTDNVIFLQIRDTKEQDVFPFSDHSSLGSVLMDPLFIIHHKWEPFQSYTQSYMKDLLPDKRVSMINLTYIPFKSDKTASLNFHITRREKEDIYKSVDNPQNRAQISFFLDLMK